MPKKQITLIVPSSVLNYFKNTAVQFAVDSLLPTKISKNIDSSFSWQELRGFNQAFLSAQVTRIEHNLFLLDILERVISENETLTIGEFEDSVPEDQSIESIWDAGSVQARVIVADVGIMVAIVLGTDSLSLQVCVDDEIKSKVNYTETWPKKYAQDLGADSYWFVAKPKDLPKPKDWTDTLDVSPLCRALDEFVQQLG
ncbi:hypothetical protein [Terasakiella pusilla]|uniref:hypothetical protein n=1 Tax=Terasakiella pusilla TaxID=64973 RepID=UPI003AA90BFE